MHPSENSSPSLACRGVVAGYRSSEPVFDGLTLEIYGFGLFRLEAPNGRGKSTLVELLSGYLRPESGSVLVNGIDAHDTRARRVRRICRTAPALYPHMNVEDHLVFASRLAGTDPSDALARAERLGLGQWLQARTDALSTGSIRKLWFVMCTVGEFQVAVLDEPFNGLDEDAVIMGSEELMSWSLRRLVLVVCHSVPPGLRFDAVTRLP